MLSPPPGSTLALRRVRPGMVCLSYPAASKMTSNSDGCGDVENLLAAGERLVLEHRRIGESEYGGVDPDAERQNRDRGGGESGIQPQGSSAVAGVLQPQLEGCQSPSLAAGVLQAGYIAELAAGFALAGAGSRLHVEVELQFVF